MTAAREKRMQTRCIEGNRLEMELFTMIWKCARLPHARAFSEKVDGVTRKWGAAEGGGGGCGGRGAGRDWYCLPRQL